MLVDTINKVKNVSIGYVGSNGLFDSATVNAYTASLRGLSETQAKVVLSSTTLDKAQQKQILTKLAETNATVSLTSAEATEALTRSLGSKEAANELLVKSGLVTEEQLLAGSTIEVTSAKIADAVATGVLTKEEGLKISTAFGLTGANIGLGTSFDLLAKSIWASIKAMAKWLVTNPVGWIILASSAVFGFIKVVDHFAVTAEKLNEQLQELKATEEELISTQDKLTEIDNKIAEIQSKGTLSITDNADISRLQIEKSLLEDEIELLKLRKELQQDEYNKNAKKYADGEYSNYTHGQGDITHLMNSYKGYKAKSERTDIDDYFIEDAKRGLKETEAELIEYRNTINENLANLAPDDEESRKKLEAIREAIEKLIYTEEELAKIKFDRFIIDPNNTGISEGFEKIKSDGEVTTQEIIELANKFPTLKKFMDDNGISAETLAAELNNVGTEAENSGENVNKMTVSLSELEKTSDNIKTLASAFKELSDDGYITTKTLGEIKTATGLADDEWEEYETRLLSAKKGSSDFNQVMSDLTYKILDATFKKEGLVDATEDEIAAVLRECNVVNAEAVARSYLANTMSSEENERAKAIISKYDLNNLTKDSVNNLLAEAESENLARNEMIKLTASTIAFNNTGLDTSKKVAQLKELALYAGVASEAQLAALDPNILGRRIGNKGGSVVDYVYNKLFGSKTGGITFTAPKYTNPSSSKSDKDPFDDSYYSIIDALIEDDKKQIEKFEKEYESLNRQFENALDTGNKEQSEILRTKLAENAKAQKDILHQQNEAHRTTQSQLLQSLYVYAPSLSGKSWGDISEVDLTNIENNLNNKVEMEADDNAKNQAKYALNQFKGIVDDLKAINNAINDNSEAWWEADENARGYWQSQIDFQDEYSNEWIDNQKAFDKLTEEEELAAYGRMINNNKEFQKQILNDMSLSEESKLALISETNDKIAEIEKNAYDLRKDVFNKATDFASSYKDSKKSLLQSYFDTTNAIAEAQHEINKELETSKTMYEWLDEDTRKLLFNQEDYNTLSEELYDIQYQADKFQRQYQRELETATLDTIEEITSNYQMQYETMMKQYEIAKAELEVAKKRQKLDNVLNERNVRMFINGQWQWVANTQDVIDAKSELADAEYARRTAEAEKTQTDSLNHLTAQQDELGTVINMFESGVIDLGTAVYKVTQMFGSLPSAMQNALSLISRSSYSSSSNGTTYSYNGLSYDPNFDYSAAMKSVPVGSDAWNRMNQRRNAKILGEGLPSSMMFASGTRYTPSGNILMGEKESETFINANGHLIPINQPTLGNFGAGGIVFNQDQMANLRSLWDLSNIGIASHNNLIGANRAQNVDNRVDNSYHVYIQNLEVDNGVIDINALKRYIPIH